MRYLLIILLFSCNPVKQVLKDQKKFDQVAEEVIRRNYCINDTVVVSKDSVVYKESIIEKQINVPCADFDSTIDGARISVSSGVLTYSHNCKEKTIIRTVTNNIRDKSLENILRSDIEVRDNTINKKSLTIKEKDAEIKSLKGDLRWEKFKLWLVFLIAGLVIFRKPLIRMIWPFSR
jgi:hypothetical protein